MKITIELDKQEAERIAHRTITDNEWEYLVSVMPDEIIAFLQTDINAVLEAKAVWNI